MDTAKVSSKYQVVIPKKARDLLGIDEGDRVIFDYREGMVVLLPKPRDFVEFARGLGAEVWRDDNADEKAEPERGSWQKASD
jgi:AbrB family looped-hinge helix DNA binding protein